MPLGIRGLQALPRFERAYKKLPRDVRAKVDAVLRELLDDDLRAGRKLEKLGGPQGVWSVRLDRSYRLTLAISGEPSESGGAVAVLRNVGAHDDVFAAP